MSNNGNRMSGNKGEWSELYAFMKLLSQGRVYAANEKVEKIDEVYYPILRIMREETRGEVIDYVIDNEMVHLEIQSNRILSVPRTDLEENANLLLKEIASHSGSFEVEEIANFANGIKVTKIKAPAADTTDISMQIEDIHTNFIRNVGFSIKSEVGNAPTLLNAGLTTNFIYKVTGITSEQAEEINAIDTRTKIKDRMAKIAEYGGSMEYYGMNHDGFKRNLIMVDSSMPEIIGNMLLYFYSEDVKDCDKLVEMLGERDPLGYGDAMMYTYKFKKFLCSCALGMKPAKPWDGLDEANGGYIIVKADGEILAYHIYNRNFFEQYLLDNTILERASTSRHEYMSLYEENGEMFIKLNLQVRFRQWLTLNKCFVCACMQNRFLNLCYSNSKMQIIPGDQKDKKVLYALLNKANVDSKKSSNKEEREKYKSVLLESLKEGLNDETDFCITPSIKYRSANTFSI